MSIPILMLPLANPSLIFQKVADGAVLFSPATETYFGLNEVGTLIWEALPTVASFERLCERVASRYPDVPAETIRQDVRELLDSLLKEGLVSAASPSTGDVDRR